MAKKILVVEDTQETQDLVFELLNMSDYEVHPAMDGLEALDMMETTMPDLVIMDIKMPRLGGVETAAKMKKDERFKYIPIIFISGLSNVDHASIKALGGRQDFVPKPLNMDVLLTKIKNLIR